MGLGAYEHAPTVARAEWHTGKEFLPEYTYTPHGMFCIDAGLRAGAPLACDGGHSHWRRGVSALGRPLLQAHRPHRVVSLGLGGSDGSRLSLESVAPEHRNGLVARSGVGGWAPLHIRIAQLIAFAEVVASRPPHLFELA